MKLLDKLTRNHALARGTCSTATRAFSSLEELNEHLSKFKGIGWVCHTDRIDRWNGGAFAPSDRPLAAELRISKEVSVGIRYAGRLWLCTEVSENLDTGDDCYFVESRKSSFAAYKNLQYRVWWKAASSAFEKEVSVYQPHLACFLGFTQSE